MIRAKCDWVYQLPCFKAGPRRSHQAALLEAFYVLFGANQYKKKIRAAHAKEKQRI
jgi:hypothetical protein